MFFHCELVILLLTLTLNSQVHTGEVVGGREAKPHSRPYMVLIELHMQNGKTKHCAGFLLSEDFVLTAAHCQARSYTALLGVHNVNKKDEIQSVSAKQAFPHKDYDPTDYRNDIMLLRLNSKANFNNNVEPIALTGQSDGPLPKSCSFSGWGDTGNKHLSPVLMEVNLTLMDNKMCPKENSYCTKGEGGPGKGDSGGPLVCGDGNGKAFGVMSCCLKINLGDSQICAFTKISDYSDWINSIMKQLNGSNI